MFESGFPRPHKAQTAVSTSAFLFILLPFLFCGVACETQLKATPTPFSPIEKLVVASPTMGVSMDTGGEKVSLVYFDLQKQTLTYSESNRSGMWVPSAVDVTGTESSLAIDSFGEPHIAYFDAGSVDLKYAYRDTSGKWHSTLIFNGGGYSCSLALDANNQAHIGFADQKGRLVYLTFSPFAPVAPAIEFVDARVTGLGSSPSAVTVAVALKLDSQNSLPIIAYYNAYYESFQVAWRTSEAVKPWKVDVLLGVKGHGINNAAQPSASLGVSLHKSDGYEWPVDKQFDTIPHTAMINAITRSTDITEPTFKDRIVVVHGTYNPIDKRWTHTEIAETTPLAKATLTDICDSNGESCTWALVFTTPDHQLAVAQCALDPISEVREYAPQSCGRWDIQVVVEAGLEVGQWAAAAKGDSLGIIYQTVGKDPSIRFLEHPIIY